MTVLQAMAEPPPSRAQIPLKIIHGYMCVVPGCQTTVDPRPKDRTQRQKVCAAHQAADAVPLPARGSLQGVIGRFCQRCARLEPMELFEGDKRSCERSLNAHNLRRRRRRAEKRAARGPKQATRCLVEGCDEAPDDRYRRQKVCAKHRGDLCVIINGSQQRLCQKCSRFEPIDRFDGAKHSCRESLALHNQRRRRSSQTSSAAAAAPTSSDIAAAKLSESSSMSDHSEPGFQLSSSPSISTDAASRESPDARSAADAVYGGTPPSDFTTPPLKKMRPTAEVLPKSAISHAQHESDPRPTPLPSVPARDTTARLPRRSTQSGEDGTAPLLGLGSHLARQLHSAHVPHRPVPQRRYPYLASAGRQHAAANYGDARTLLPDFGSRPTGPSRLSVPASRPVLPTGSGASDAVGSAPGPPLCFGLTQPGSDHLITSVNEEQDGGAPPGLPFSYQSHFSDAAAEQLLLEARQLAVAQAAVDHLAPLAIAGQHAVAPQENISGAPGAYDSRTWSAVEKWEAFLNHGLSPAARWQLEARGQLQNDHVGVEDGRPLPAPLFSTPASGSREADERRGRPPRSRRASRDAAQS